MSNFENPAIAALVKRIDPQLTWGQVHIQLVDDGGFELRHVVHAEANADTLSQAQTADLRSLAGQAAEVGGLRLAKRVGVGFSMDHMP